MSELIEDMDELPARPRLRLFTPVTGGLLALLIAAGGFTGGVLVEKGQTSSGGSGQLAGGPSQVPRLLQGGGEQGGASAPTFGQVSSVQGRDLFVTTAQGNTVKVRVPKGAMVTRTVKGSARSVHPGETVVVQGSTGSDGSITASSVQDSGTRGGGGGSAVLNQLFGGGGGK